MSAYLDWHVGMKVVCTKQGVWIGDNEIVHPVGGEVYTIRSMEFADGALWLTFHEIHNPVKNYWSGVHEAQFCAVRFRPVQKRATDISIFHALLTPSEDDKAEIELLDYESMAVPFQ